MSDDAVVAEGEELLARGVPRVPAAERRGRLVREHYVVLAVVEYCLGAMLLCKLVNQIPLQLNILLIRNRTCFPVAPAPVYATRHRTVESSHNFAIESRPEERMYLPLRVNWTEHTSIPSWACWKVATH